MLPIRSSWRRVSYRVAWWASTWRHRMGFTSIGGAALR